MKKYRKVVVIRIVCLKRGKTEQVKKQWRYKKDPNQTSRNKNDDAWDENYTGWD